MGEMVYEKQAIAREALKLVQDNDAIFMGSGTSTLELAKLLQGSDLNITLLTNSLLAVYSIRNASNIRISVTGGDFQEGILSLVGPAATRAVEGLSGRIFFFGANGVDPNGGLTAHFSGQADLNRKMMSACKICVAMVDSSKFNMVSPFRICNLDDPDYIITDSKLPAEARDTFTKADANLVIAEP
jgi:DeoR/GlpR family transcriptional regulator of sugar metabolism